MSHSPAQLYTQPTFLELFTPKLITVFREGYGWRDLRADAVSGLGFTAGIAVIIAASQIRDLLGLALIAVSVAAIVCAVFPIDVATVHSRFGAIPGSFPIPSLPVFSLEKIQAVLPDGI
ncbi:MAG: hypothetical protein WCD87_02910, partial [Pseudolabrys sp.]